MGEGKGRPRLALSPDYDHPKRLDQRWRPAPLQIDSSCRGGWFRHTRPRPHVRRPDAGRDRRRGPGTASDCLQRDLSHRPDPHDGNRADLPGFHSLLVATAKRRGFSPPPFSFFDAAWSAMAPSGMLRMAVAEVAGEPVSAFLWVSFGDTMNCWRGGVVRGAQLSASQ